jgi:hypothetical protein
MEAWSGHTALVPTTEHGEEFGAWEDVDPARPTLVKTGSEERLTVEQQNVAGTSSENPAISSNWRKIREMR